MKKLPLLFASLALTALSYSAMIQAAEPPTYEQNQQTKIQLQQVNINQAKAKDFIQLRGIGEKKAQAIIQYRKLNGAYNSLNDLLKVKGIGQKILIDNKALLTI
ncbi:MAG: helix-hairpin-helix domain-containing protein [Alteromonadaceae bacterium]|nr:helix-hairpin-helix domain-containing protein [Alteromonadaceae bacterium]